MSKLQTADEIAKQLRVTAATIHAWHRRGLIPCIRAGHHPVLFDAHEVLAALRCDSDVDNGTGEEVSCG